VEASFLIIQGYAELPLHEGKVPAYLFEKMLMLGSLIANYIIEVYGPDELLSRLSDPVWFQGFNNVIGMDWNSSGSTTVVLYVLKRVFPQSNFNDTGLAVVGGKGKDAINTPREVEELRGDIDKESIIRASRLSAKIDGVALQDDYQLYIHGLVLSSSNKLLVIQQGMNPNNKLARRYHLLINDPHTITAERDPHTAVASISIAPALNLVDQGSLDARRAILDILVSSSQESLYRDILTVNRVLRGVKGIDEFLGKTSVLTIKNIDKSRCPSYYRAITDFERVAKAAAELKKESPNNFDELLLIRGAGPETVRALALVSHLIYGYEPSFRDPTTHPIDPFIYAYAHGGKDRVPYKINVRRIEKTIEFFQDVLNNIKAGNKEKEEIAKNLANMVNRLIIKGIIPKIEK
jgi:hypothetical protein